MELDRLERQSSSLVLKENLQNNFLAKLQQLNVLSRQNPRFRTLSLRQVYISPMVGHLFHSEV